MGDRTWVDVSTNRPGYRAFCESDRFQKPDEETWDGNFVSLQWCEVNYAGWDDLQQLAEAGIIFEGRHGNGGDYRACQFVGWGGKFFSMEGEETAMVPAEVLVNEATFKRELELYGPYLRASQECWEELQKYRKA